MSDEHAPLREAGTIDAAEHARLVAVVVATSARGTAAMRRLWDDLVATHGEAAASRVWQEALSQSDIGQT